jgi:hypothetical protein
LTHVWASTIKPCAKMWLHTVTVVIIVEHWSLNHVVMLL